MKTSKLHRLLRRATERALGLLLMRGRIARLSWRLGGHGQLRVARHAVRLAAGQHLPRPLTIAFASDFHAGPTTDPAIFAALLEQLRRERPDLLLLGGDYVSFDAAHIAQLTPFLAQARAPLGNYAVLGNHDVWNGREAIGAALAAAGVELLVNRNAALPAPFDAVSVCGIDDPWSGAPDPDAAFDGAGPVRIYLMHSPDGLWRLGARRFDLGLAGHTHGGQIVRRNGVPLKRPSGPYSREFIHGRFALPGHGPLLVGRGIGCAGIPLRLRADPELLICTLH